MKIAFLCSAYTDPQHLQRLIEALPDESEYFVHVDAKSDIMAFKRTLQTERVHFICERYNVVWGSFTQVQYQIVLIRAAIDSGIAFDFLLTMSGMEYPVWGNRRIEAFFNARIANDEELLQGVCMTTQPFRQQRLYVEHWPLNNCLFKPGSLRSKCRVALRKTLYAAGWRKPLEFDADGHHYHLYKGSDWFGITPRLGRFVLERWDASPQLQRYFRDGFAPSETAIHTIVFNDDAQRARCILITDSYRRLADLTPLSYIDYQPGSVVRTLDESYYDTVLSADKMFCRKVVTGKSDRLADMLDAHRQEEDHR